MSRMDHISVILVNYNSDELTKMCLKSLQDVKAKNFEFSVIVVDNASQQPLKLPRSLQADQVEVIRSEANLGFSGGNNLGITYAAEKYDPDYICLLNNDTTVDPDFLQELYNTIEGKPEIGMVTPKIYFAPGFEYHHDAYQKADEGNVIWYAGGSIDWPNLIAFHRGVDEIDRGQLDEPSEVDFNTGCCILISRDVLETVGMLDDKLFLYYEDADLSLRTQQKGYKTLYCPQSVIWHHNGGSSGGAGSPLHTYYQNRNRIYLGLKYGSWRVRITSLAFAFRTMMNGTPVERKAATHALIGQMGKQPYDKI